MFAKVHDDDTDRSAANIPAVSGTVLSIWAGASLFTFAALLTALVVIADEADWWVEAIYGLALVGVTLSTIPLLRLVENRRRFVCRSKIQALDLAVAVEARAYEQVMAMLERAGWRVQYREGREPEHAQAFAAALGHIRLVEAALIATGAYAAAEEVADYRRKVESTRYDSPKGIW